MTDSLGTLLGASFTAFQKKFTPIAVGAVLLAVLMLGAQTSMQKKALHVMENNPHMDSMMDLEKLEDLAKRAEDGDEAALAELMDGMGAMGMMDEDGNFNEEAMEEVGKSIMLSMAPTFGSFFLVSFLLSLIGSVYFLVVAVQAKVTVGSAFSATPKLLLPMLGVWLWSFLRSFAWIPVIGIIFAIVIGPRLVLAPVILIKEKKGVLESVRSSYERSKGYWGKVIGNSIVAGICTALAIIVAGIITGLLPQSVSIITSLILGYLGTAYGTIFIVKLSETILKNPQK